MPARSVLCAPAFALLVIGTAPTCADILYATSALDDNIQKFTSSGVGSVFAGYPAQEPWGLGFDKSANLYVANGTDHHVVKFTPGGVGSVFATIPYVLGDLAIDKAGNLYVASSYNDRISKVTPSGAVSTFASG